MTKSKNSICFSVINAIASLEIIKCGCMQGALTQILGKSEQKCAKNQAFFSKLCSSFFKIKEFFPLEFSFLLRCWLLYGYFRKASNKAYIWNKRRYTAQNMKFSIKDFFSKCNQIYSFLWMWSYLLKKSLMKNFIFCAVGITEIKKL